MIIIHPGYSGLCLSIAVILSGAVSGRIYAADNLESLEERAFKQAAALVDPSIVQIQTVGGLDRVGQVLTGTGPTTGVVVSKEGHVISSSFNFASKPASILVQLPDGRRFTANVVASDESRMLTLLKIEAKDSDLNLTPAEAAKEDELKVGQWSLAMGRTYSIEIPSVSVGIVSALDRVWGKAVQTDAKVSPVNYGGPLVNVEGKVIGILVPLSTRGGSGETAGVEWYDSGIGFAISLEDVYRVLDRLKKGEALKAGLLGVGFDGKDALGGVAKIDRVRVNSPADEAGLEKGDVFTEVDGRKIGRQSDVRHALGDRYAGETVKVVVKRGDKEIAKELKLVGELVPYESGFLGILPIREAADKKDGRGVGVRYVYKESPAEKAGLKNRDRIVKFNDEATPDAATLLNLVSHLRPGEKASLVFLRDGKEQTVEVELASIPDLVPEELRSSPVTAAAADVEKPKTGHFNKELAEYEHNYWAYVPDDYNPAYRYGLMVWIHPDEDTMEAAILKDWEEICQQRGLLLVAPEAEALGGWSPNEAEFCKAAVEDVIKEYNVDPDRVFLHSYSKGGEFGWTLAFKYRELFRGLAASAAPLRTKPPENDPDYRQQFHLQCGEKDPLARLVEQSAQNLQKLKFPASYSALKGLEHKYPDKPGIEEIARWADALDRI